MKLVKNTNTTEAFRFKNNEIDFTFVSLSGYSTKGFFMDNDSPHQALDFVNKLYESGDYKKLLLAAVDLTSRDNPDGPPNWTGYFGLEGKAKNINDGSNIVFKICFDTSFKKTDVQFVLGTTTDTLETLAENLVGEMQSSAIYQIGACSDTLKKFFLSYTKKELSTILKVQRAISLHIRLENKLSDKQKRDILDYAKKYCMNRYERNIKPKRTFLEIITFKKVEHYL